MDRENDNKKMMEKDEYADECNYCGKKTLKQYIKIENLSIFNGMYDNDYNPEGLDFSIMLCENCGLIQQRYSELLDQTLEDIYLSEKSSLSTPLGTGSWGEKRLNRFLKNADLKEIPNGVLEIGCGTGLLLYELFKRGARDLFCFEPSTVIQDVTSFNKDFTPIIYNDFFNSCAIKSSRLEDKFNLVVGVSVLEHIKDLKDFLKATNLALKGGGIGIFIVPNELFSFNIINPGLMIHEHLNYFTPNTIKSILEASGLDVFHIAIEHDSILVKFKKIRDFSNHIDGTIQLPLINENKRFLKKYSLDLEKVINRFEKAINSRQREKIGLYGACTASYNLLQLSDHYIESNIIFIDSDPTKWNKKLLGIPIISPSEIIEQDITSIIVIPPAFQDEIEEHLISLKLPKKIEIVKFFNEAV